ncbi:MAG TPA: hypothetical protein VGR26_16515 [Acidimicrobiales bacterium]|nr:hypothetical protein [Acidimicrobiales bacterium]
MENSDHEAPRESPVVRAGPLGPVAGPGGTLDVADHHDAAGEEWVIAPRAVELSSVVVGVDVEVATSLKSVVAGFEASTTRNPAG